MHTKLLIFDSHPVQYRVPVWQAMEVLSPGTLHVVYASDCSVRGHTDSDFGKTFSWDEPLLEGYQNTILNCEKGTPLLGWGSLTGKGVKKVIKVLKPDAILITGLNYMYDLEVYLYALIHHIPIWLRCETQDRAFKRNWIKSVGRSLVYRLIYLGIKRFFYIGELNREHYINHGISASRLYPAYYCTKNRYEKLQEHEKQELRSITRMVWGINQSDFVVGFSGKFISKKNPEILFDMLEYLPDDLRSKVHLYFVGAGNHEVSLKILANRAYEKHGVKCSFVGFVNQSRIAAHYLAMDILILPSRRMGETWGLVANEAMQAGCGVIVSDAVGCSADFKSFKLFKIFEEGNASQLSNHVNELSSYPRTFEWASQSLELYSVSETAKSIMLEFAR